MTTNDATQHQHTTMTSNTDTLDIVENRSEIVFLFDAVDANPNGNPMSPSNRPRIDPQTQQCIVTDVRLKRYIRDQLQDDFEGEEQGVYVRSPDARDEFAPERKELFADVLGLTEGEELDDTLFDDFLDAAIDARYFGATFSFNTDDGFMADVAEHVPASLTGALQFSPGKSMHPVELNEQYNSLTSVISTGENKEQGGFDLDDERVKYAFMRFNGVLNENVAEENRLRESDVDRLDHLLWRALKNQTMSRSKTGQEPRLYARVEYETDNFHDGDLHTTFDLAEQSAPNQELRTIEDVVLDATAFVDRVASLSNHVETVHLAVSDRLQFNYDGEVVDSDAVIDALDEHVEVNVVEPYAAAQ